MDAVVAMVDAKAAWDIAVADVDVAGYLNTVIAMTHTNDVVETADVAGFALINDYHGMLENAGTTIIEMTEDH